MSPTTVGFIGIVLLFILLAFRMHVGLAMALVGLLGFMYLTSIGGALGTMGTAPRGSTAYYPLSVIPLFILMGQLAYHAGLSRDVYYAGYKVLGQLRGGLSMATIAGCAGFAAICGSSLATAATMGTVALPEMRRYNYKDTLATGCVAAGGTLGILIPPSVALVLYGIMAEQSIGKLLIAGILPGLLLAGLFMLTTYIHCRINPHLGPAGPKAGLRERLTAIRDVWPVVVLFLLVMGGIYMGFFTPTEAAAIGAFGAFLFAIGKRRLTRQNLFASLLDTGRTTAMIFLIMIGAGIFGYFLAATRIPYELAGVMAALPLPRYAILAIILFMYLILGCFMEGVAITILTVPIIFPVISVLGFDPIWYGIVFTVTMEMGLITPPVGMNVFVLSGVARDVPLYTIFRGIFPFLAAMIVCVIILLIFPQIAVFLPNLMR